MTLIVSVPPLYNNSSNELISEKNLCIQLTITHVESKTHAVDLEVLCQYRLLSGVDSFATRQEGRQEAGVERVKVHGRHVVDGDSDLLLQQVM